MLPAPAFLFLAEASESSVKLDASNPTVFMGLLIGGLITLIVGADKIDSMIARRKRQPSLDEALTLKANAADLQTKADRSELHVLQLRMETEIAAMRSFQSKNTREIFARIETESKETRSSVDALGKTINKEFITLYRALGKIEGVTLEERND